MRNYIAIVLDNSGSMESVRDVTISGFNEQVQTIRKNSKEKETFVSFICFNDRVKEIYFNQEVSSLKEINKDVYVPDGSTAMYDAVGYTINRLVATTDQREEDRYLIIIVSDGEENASKDFSAEALAKKISALQNTKKWTFTYMGANQDLSQISKTLKIPKGNLMSYDSTVIGTRDAFKGMSMATANYVSSGVNSMASFYSKEAETPVSDPQVDSQKADLTKAVIDAIGSIKAKVDSTENK